MRRIYVENFIALVDDECCESEKAIGKYIYSEGNPHNGIIL